jgi:serine/tyrosine/threonine adenylyltransferase
MTDLQSPPIYELGESFYDEVEPAKFPQKILRYYNPSLGLETISDFTKDHLWHFEKLEGNISKPLALRYHGHQFRYYNPELGDGRGFLYAQIKVNNQWYDLGTKGSGTTPYSRQGDGRLTLKGAFREALATETLQSYGVNTSKTACFFETGENLVRGDEPSPTRSAVMTRFSLGHIRIGTFQRLAFFNDTENIKKLTKYVLKYYYQDECKNVNWNDCHDVATRFLQCVSDRLAHLSAQIMIAGFVHGVLNSDNINVSGELFDYGPYRFLPDYDPQFTAAYFDQQGLYCFGAQPNNFLWNLQQLAACLTKACPDLPAQIILENFEDLFNDYLYQAFQNKLNIRFRDDEIATEALSLFFQTVQDKGILYEEAFFAFHSSRVNIDLPFSISTLDSAIKLKNLTSQSEVIDQKINEHPYFKKEKPETLLIDEIEMIWSSISEKDDWSLFYDKLQRLRSFRGCYKL